jgi:hypothetical protein
MTARGGYLSSSQSSRHLSLLANIDLRPQEEDLVSIAGNLFKGIQEK